MVIQEIRKFGERGPAGGGKEYITFRDIWSFLCRHIVILALMTILGIGLGVLYMTKTQPTYSAVARLVIDREQARIASQDASTGTIIIEAAEIASEVEIVKSEGIARAVIRELDLVNDREIMESQSWRSTLRSWLLSALTFFRGADEEEEAEPEVLSEEDLMRRTMAGFLSRLSVHRVGQSYVLEIGYTSTDPVKAARTANAVAKAYMQASLASKSEALERGAAWLEDRLVALGEQAHEAALAVEQYRNEHDITEVGTSVPLDHQQVAEISTQLLAAQADTATESARVATIDRLLAGDMSDGYVGEALNNTQISKLREDLRVATDKLEALQSRYGAGSIPVITAEAEIARLNEEIRKELIRIQGVYRSNLETAIRREKLLREQLENLKRRAADANLARVKLAELESKATTYQRMYEELFKQLIGALQKQSFPVGDVRMVTAATPPLAKTWPKTTLIMPFAMMLGLAGGVGLSALREVMDRRIGSGERLGRELGLPSLGRVPSTRFRSGKGAPAHASLRYVLDAPYSGFSEALRSVKNSIDATFPATGAMVIGVTSVNSGEGKSTIATNLAQLYLNEGMSVILIDADFLNPHVSRVAEGQGEDLGLAVARLPSPALGHAKSERLPARYAAAKNAARPGELKEREAANRIQEEDAGLESLVPVLTVEQIKRSANPSHRYGHLPALKAQIELLRRRYGVIILDLPAFERSVDARVASTYVDGLLLILGQHRKMTVERLADALATFGKSRIGILGVVFNRSTRSSRRAVSPGFVFRRDNHGES